jgi:hypothetical protein
MYNVGTDKAHKMTDLLHFDLRDFERQARRLGAAIDQVPYALVLVSQFVRITVISTRPGDLMLQQDL